MIPKLIHFIWVGDETKRPDCCMQTWRDLSPGHEFILGGNLEFEEQDCFNQAHMYAMYSRGLSGVFSDRRTIDGCSRQISDTSLRDDRHFSAGRQIFAAGTTLAEVSVGL